MLDMAKMKLHDRRMFCHTGYYLRFDPCVSTHIKLSKMRTPQHKRLKRLLNRAGLDLEIFEVSEVQSEVENCTSIKIPRVLYGESLNVRCKFKTEHPIVSDL
jgi:hypothetical protein